MEKIKIIIAWIIANKKIVLPVSAAIGILIVGIVFGAKIKGCVDKMSTPPEIVEVKK